MMSVSPNPFSNSIVITSSEIKGQIDIVMTDITGRTVYQGSTNFMNRAEIQLEDMPKGMYILKVQQGNNQMTYRMMRE